MEVSMFMRNAMALVVVVWAVHVGSLAAQEPLKKPKLDRQGDPLPAGALVRLGTARWRLHENALAFAPNGRFAVVADDPPRLVDAETGHTVRTIDTPALGAFVAADGKTALLAHEGIIRFLNVDTGKVVRELKLNGDVWAWAGDGKRAVCAHQLKNGNWSYCVWDLDQGIELCRWERRFGTCALSADGARMAVRSGREIGVYSVSDKKPVCEWDSADPFAGRTQHARVVLFLDAGKTVVAAETGRVLLWDAATGQVQPKRKLAPVLATARDDPVTLAASADGRYLAAGGSKGTLYLWDLHDDRLLHTLPDAGRGWPIYILNLTADGKRLVSQAHQFPSARVWDVASGKEVTPADVPAGNIDKIAFSPDGNAIATIGPRDPVLLWDAGSGKLRHRLNHGSFAWSSDGTTVATARPDGVSLWNLRNGSLRRHVKGLPANVDPKEGKGFAWTSGVPDSNTVLAVFSGDVKLTVPGVRGGRDRNYFWTTIGLADAQTGKLRRYFRVDCEYMHQTCVSPDGRLLAAIGTLHGRGVNACTMLVWDLQRGVELCRADLPVLYDGEQLSFSADSRTVLLTASASMGNRHEHLFGVVEVVSGSKRAWFTQEKDSRWNFSRGALCSEDLAAIANGPTIALFNPVNGRALGQVQANQGKVGCLAFAPDGQRLACAGNDTTALIWDIRGMTAAPARVRLAERDLERVWADLLANDGATVLTALRRLVQAGDQATRFLDTQMQPAPVIPAETIKKMIARLNSTRFADREEAAREALRLGELALADLENMRDEPPSVEAKRRAEDLLRKIYSRLADGPFTLSGAPLRDWRAVEVLERIGTPEATRVLERLALGGSHAVLTREARAAVQRLTKTAASDKKDDGITDSVGIKLVRIKKGEFTMGSEELPSELPVHKVRLTKDFFLAAHPVTVGQFKAFVKDTGYKTEAEKGKGALGFDADTRWLSSKGPYNWRNPGFEQADDHPVVCVSWHDADAFCKWLSKKEGKAYRLPTEAEFEYAARAGTTTRFSCGDADESLKGHANLADQALLAKMDKKIENQPAPKGNKSGGIAVWDDGFAFTSPVGQFKPNPWGLYDMHGNVWTWCSDWAVNRYQPGLQEDPTGPAEPGAGKGRCLRGGTWFIGPLRCRSANRVQRDPDASLCYVGFRVARTAD
jgi:formylglycine-generating enzyme required for sulfatase activity/WD40 repeat protein